MSGNVKRVFRQTLSVQETARRCDVSVPTVYRRLKKADLKLLRQINGNKEKEEIIIKTLKQAGFSGSHIADLFAVTPQYISQVITNERQKLQSA